MFRSPYGLVMGNDCGTILPTMVNSVVSIVSR